MSQSKQNRYPTRRREPFASVVQMILSFLQRPVTYKLTINLLTFKFTIHIHQVPQKRVHFQEDRKSIATFSS
ncbi:hypothetical protein Hanom_Chr04g00307561 [Helianthus anomalus]